MLLPKLPVLLEKPTVLILGAGASADYGFPLWVDLKQQFYNCLVGNGIFDLSGHPGASHWIDVLRTSDGKTIDNLAAEAPDDGVELFQLLIVSLLSEQEKHDKNNRRSGWIEKLSFVYCNLLSQHAMDKFQIRKLFQNLKIVSFNYERCFHNRFSRPVLKHVEQLYKNTITKNAIIENERPRCIHIYQPHGSLGSLPQTKQGIRVISKNSHFNSAAEFEVEYGIERNQAHSNSKFQTKSIVPVDFTRLYTNNRAYHEANSVIQNSGNIILIGMSDEGFNETQLNKVWDGKFYSTGDSKLTDNCIPLACLANEIDWI